MEIHFVCHHSQFGSLSEAVASGLPHALTVLGVMVEVSDHIHIELMLYCICKSEEKLILSLNFVFNQFATKIGCFLKIVPRRKCKSN